MEDLTDINQSDYQIQETENIEQLPSEEELDKRERIFNNIEPKKMFLRNVNNRRRRIFR